MKFLITQKELDKIKDQHLKSNKESIIEEYKSNLEDELKPDKYYYLDITWWITLYHTIGTEEEKKNAIDRLERQAINLVCEWENVDTNWSRYKHIHIWNYFLDKDDAFIASKKLLEYMSNWKYL